MKTEKDERLWASMELLRGVLEWLFSAIASNVVSTYFVRVLTNLFPGLGRFFVSGRAWVTGGKVLYAGGYEDVKDSDHLVFLRRGDEFPAGVDGAYTSWQMTIWDAGEAEKAAEGCRSEVGVFTFVALIILGFVLWFRWILSLAS